MRRKWKIMISIILMVVLNVIPAQADIDSYYGVPIEKADYEITQYISDSVAIAKSIGQERGSVIDTAIAQITNLGGGDVDVVLITTAHVECEEIKNLAILERQEGNSWKEISRYEFTALKEDFPTEDLSGMTNEFTIENLDTDYYYRIRGVHCVWAEGKSQIFVTLTPGVLVTEYEY